MILMGIIGGLFLLTIFLYIGKKIIEFIHEKMNEQALNGQFDRFRIVDEDGKRFKVQRSFGKWLPEWERIPYSDVHYNIDDAKKELAKHAKQRAKEVADEIAQRKERFQDIKTRKQIIKDHKKLMSGVALPDVKDEIPEEWV